MSRYAVAAITQHSRDARSNRSRARARGADESSTRAVVAIRTCAAFKSLSACLAAAAVDLTSVGAVVAVVDDVDAAASSSAALAEAAVVAPLAQSAKAATSASPRIRRMSLGFLTPCLLY